MLFGKSISRYYYLQELLTLEGDIQYIKDVAKSYDLRAVKSATL